MAVQPLKATSSAKNLRHVILSALLVFSLGSLGPCAWGAEENCVEGFANLVDPQLRAATAAERRQNRVAEVYGFITGEPIIFAAATFRQKYDRIRAANLIKSSETKKVYWARPQDSGFVTTNWEPVSFRVPAVHGTGELVATKVVSPGQLKLHFTKTLEPENAKAVRDMIDAFGKKDEIISWAISVRDEMATLMKADGVSEAAQSHPHVRELYLDKILMKRAVANGFAADSKGLPSNIVTFNSVSFFRRTLGQGKLFVDWTGVDLSNSVDGGKHFARGHLLAMTYASEKVPNFVSLMKTVGQTSDRDGVWEMLFDNLFAQQTPYWGGTWVRELGPIVGIRY